jgi:hypothetical protein
VDRLRGHRVLRRRAAEVSAESALRGARASAALEGADWPLEEIRRRTAFGEDPDGAVVQGALRVSTELGTLVETWRRAPLQVLARLHVVGAADLVRLRAGRPGGSESPSAGAADMLGRPRDAGEPATDRLDLGPAPSAAEVAARLEALAQVLVRQTTAPALVTAAVAHGELLTLRPFALANGLVARAAERLVLIGRGLDPRSFSAPEVGHAELGVEVYTASLRGYASGTPGGVAAWIVHCAEAVVLGAREGIAVCEALQRG